MLKVDKRQLSSAKLESDIQGQTNHYIRKQRRGSGGSNKRACPQSSRKTPSPHKEIKVLQRRSPTSPVIGSPNAGTTGYHTQMSRNSPTRMLPKCKEVIEEKLATSPAQRALNFNDLELLNSDTYAGARFHSPPTPDALPKPPTHWMTATCATMNHMFNAPHLNSITTHLKGLLNVQA